MQRRSVDLPPPDGPTRAVTLPSPKVTLTSFSTTLSPKLFSICLRSESLLFTAPACYRRSNGAAATGGMAISWRIVPSAHVNHFCLSQQVAKRKLPAEDECKLVVRRSSAEAEGNLRVHRTSALVRQ